MRNRRGWAAAMSLRCAAEALEPRVVLSTFTVSNTLDSGTGSLRQAILDANTAMGTNNIVFAASFSSSAHTITFTTATPQINFQLTITGPGASLLTVTRSGNVTTTSNVFNSFATVLNMSGMTVTGGNINANGGGLSVSGISPNVTLDSMVFTGNTANGNGGAISLNNNATLTIRNSTITNNTATTLGGGIFFFMSGSLVMQNCTVAGNTAGSVSGHGGSGGGIYFVGTALASPPTGYTASTLLVKSSTFSNNTATVGGGGAIATDDFTGTVLLQNSTLTANTAGTSGGGVWCIGNTAAVGSVALQDCTVASNTAHGTAAGTGGGGVARVGAFTGSITLTGTIVYGNSNPGGAAPDVFAGTSFTTTTANFCDISSSAGFTLSGSSANNLPFGTNPVLGALANNGGTTLTMALQPDSSAINAGTTISGITTDQRGIARPQGSAPDIGAFERQATAASLTSMSYEYLTRQAVTFNFNADASVTFSGSSYTLVNRTTSQTLPASTGTLNFNGTGTIATLVLTNLLTNANYRVTSGAMTLDFFVLAGDATQDRSVDTLDFNALAANFGGTGKNYSQADFNYDGKVDTLDFNTLAANFGKTLPPAMQLAAATVPPLNGIFSARPTGDEPSPLRLPTDQEKPRLLLP